MKTINKEPVYRVNLDADLTRLQSIAKQTNEYISRGECCVVTLGHSGESDPDMMAVSCGYLDNFLVEGDILYADLHIDDAWKDARELDGRRRKSLEIWSDDIVSCCALLCRNRPALELGMVKYETPKRDGMQSAKYNYDEDEQSQEKDVANMSPAEIQQLFTECLNHSDIVAKFNELADRIIPTLQEKLVKLEDTLAPLMEEEAEEPGHEDIAPELEEEAADIEGEDVEKNELLDKSTQMIKDESMGEEAADNLPAPSEEGEEDSSQNLGQEPPDKSDMASASANNTYLPGFAKKPEDDEEDNKKKLIKKYQLEAQQALEERNEAVKRYQMEIRRSELKDLARDRPFDVEEELALVGDLNDEQFARHKKIVVTRYQKAPLGRTVSPVVELQNKDDIVVRAEKAARARDLALKEGVTFLEAMKRVS